MNRQRLASLAGVAIGLLGLGFLALRLSRDWDEVTTAFTETDPRWALVAFASGTGAMSVIAVNWVVLLRGRGAAVATSSGFAWFFVGQLGKYVPGGMWPVVGQAYLAARGGVARRDAYTATATSMVATLTGAAAFASITGVATSSDRRWIAAAIGVALVSGLGVISAEAGRRRLESLIAMLVRRPIPLPAGRFLTVQTLRHVPVWLLFGVMNVAVVIALDGSPSTRTVLEVLFASTLSWMAGFVVVGLPGGIGVREAVLVSALTGPLGAGVALSVAITSRIVSILVDVVAASASPLVARITA